MIHSYSVPPTRVSSEVVENEALIINLDTGDYYTTAHLGCFIWILLGEGFSSEEISRKICSRVKGADFDIEQEIRRFIAELEKETLIERVDVPMEPSEVQLPWNELKDRGAPQLKKYTDMRELLLIDPIHDEGGWPGGEPDAPEA